jgi:hypothetical protein
MNKSLRGAAASLTLAALLAVGTPSLSKPSSSKPTPPANPLTQNLGLQGQSSVFSQTDPKHPAWLLWKLVMRQFLGNLAADNDTVSGRGVTVILFNNGKRDGVMTAPTATGYFHTETIIASGGVLYTSVSHPGSFLSADTVTWNARTKMGLARGNVRYRNNTGARGQTPFVYFDAGLKVLSSTPLSGGG